MEFLTMKHGAILLITFNRPTELSLVLDSIHRSNLDSIRRLVVIQQPGNSQISEICSKINWIEFEHHLNEPPGKSTPSHINNNIFVGLDLVFQDSNIDWVAVLEDDIVVARDFFRFIDFVIKFYASDRDFRGVNGFSGLPNNEDNTSDQFGEYRYGFGWGWAINRRTWSLLQKFWNGKEETHWDGHVEHLVKTGFVVMPIRSRILNIGFNERATHTKRVGNSIPQEEEKLNRSFLSTQYLGVYRRVTKSLDWRKDCRIYVRTPVVLALSISMLYRVLFYFRPLIADCGLCYRLKRAVRRTCEFMLDKLYKFH